MIYGNPISLKKFIQSNTKEKFYYIKKWLKEIIFPKFQIFLKKIMYFLSQDTTDSIISSQIFLSK